MHPEVVGKLVVVSTPFRRNGFYPDILAQQGQVTAAAAEGMKQTPMYQLYASLAPAVKWPLRGINAPVDADGLIAGDTVDEVERGGVRRDRAPGGQVG